MDRPRGFLLCATPRTGSTLLCSLLASTGVLGRPQSYFREPDEIGWAGQFGLAVVDGRVEDYGAFVRAVREEATTGNGVFAARLMWGALDRMLRGLCPAPLGARSERDLLEKAFGSLTFVFLHRRDVLGQAVSWCRAEQTGYWQEGDEAEGVPQQDVETTAYLRRVIDEHNDAWRSWFARDAVSPIEVTYEGLVQDPTATVRAIGRELGVDLPERWRAEAPQRRQADDLSRRWADAVRAHDDESPSR